MLCPLKATFVAPLSHRTPLAAMVGYDVHQIMVKSDPVAETKDPDDPKSTSSRDQQNVCRKRVGRVLGAVTYKSVCVPGTE